MRLDFLFPGDWKNRHLASASEEWLKRSGSFGRIQIRNLDVPRKVQGKDVELFLQTTGLRSQESHTSPPGPEDIALCKALSSYQQERYFLVLLDERGTLWNSTAFSKQVTQWRDRTPGPILVAGGGAFSYHPALRAKAQALWSLSPLIFPHEVAWTLAVEQVYRALCIEKGHPYHHES